MKSTDKVLDRNKPNLMPSGGVNLKFQPKNKALTSRSANYRMAPDVAEKMQLLKDNLGISFNDIMDRCVRACIDQMLEDNDIT